MLKLLIWAGIIYLIYRYFQQANAQLKSGGKSDVFQRFFKQPHPPTEKPKEGEFVDYEEISSKHHERK